MALPCSLPHYAAHADDYIAALLSHDTGDARERFLAALASGAEILDLGCGPGRDLKAFVDAGYRAVGLEGCPALAEAARRHAGAELWERDLFAPALPPARFDGVWAQAVLFHVPTGALASVLSDIRDTLKPDGILYACDPTGADQEGWAEDRYLAFRRPQTLKKKARMAGFDLIGEWRRPPGLPRRQQTWLATLWRRV